MFNETTWRLLVLYNYLDVIENDVDVRGDPWILRVGTYIPFYTHVYQIMHLYMFII